MKVDEVLKKLGALASTKQSERESVSVSLSPDECSCLIAEVAVLRAQWKGYVVQRDAARMDAIKQKEVADFVLATIDEARMSFDRIRAGK